MAKSTPKDSQIILNMMKVQDAINKVIGESDDETIAKKSTISFLIVSGLNSMPTGCCIHAFATKIQRAEMLAPMAVNQVDAKWNFGLTLFQPKNITAMNVDSIKNANMPSIANGAPKISPTNQL